MPKRRRGRIPAVTILTVLAALLGTTVPQGAAEAPKDSGTRSGADSGAVAAWKAAPPSGWFGRPSDLQVPPYIDRFEGLDLSALTPSQRELFIHRANTELCTCGQSGCLRHTLGFCLKVDPGCPRAGGMLREIYDALRGAAGTAGMEAPGAGETPAETGAEDSPRN